MPRANIATTVAVAYAFLVFSPIAVARIEVQGHRGARAMRPENTLPAFQYAIEQGVDVLEMDMAVTKDGVIVISHDPRINKELCLMPNGKPVTEMIPIHQLTLKEVKAFDCASIRHPKFATQMPMPGTRIPTLDEVFDLVEGSKLPGAKTVRFNIETKIVPRFVGTLSLDPQAFAASFLATVKRRGMLGRVVLQSFDHRALAYAKAMEPHLKIALLVDESLPDVAALIKAAHADILSPHMDWIDRGVVDAAHKVGAEVIPWTADSADDWAYLTGIGVDGIITDDPKGLIDWLKSKKLF